MVAKTGNIIKVSALWLLVLSKGWGTSYPELSAMLTLGKHKVMEMSKYGLSG
jgi:hypothetical protein